MSSLIIAAAGAGKTTFLVKKALEISENVLITTYTDANEQSIRDKFYEINGCIPSNVTIMPWFSLLIKHGIRPYQSYLINNRVSGVLLVNKADKNLLRLKDTNEKKYVTASGNVYSNMISKLPCVLDELSNGCVFRRIRKIFSYVFVDEIQDFVGYDLEVIKKLHEVGCNMTLVGDPRQTTYRTHYEAKYKKYAGYVVIFILLAAVAAVLVEFEVLSTVQAGGMLFLAAGIFIYAAGIQKENFQKGERKKSQVSDDFDEETLTTIYKFFENSLNVSETSRQLFIHRNTLVYRLDKLQKSTGLDLRVFEDAITFKIALMVVKYMKYMETYEY